jgi:hypothetical protein
MYVCMYVCVCIQEESHTFRKVHVPSHHVNACPVICMYVCMRAAHTVCMCEQGTGANGASIVCMHVYVFSHVFHIYTHARTHTRTHTHTRIHTYTHAYTET